MRRRKDQSSPPPPSSLEQINAAISAYQSVIKDADERMAGIEERSGITGKRTRVSVLDHPWKEDDAAWFKANPTRSHRARPMYIGEMEIAGLSPEQPPTILVRQVEPGTRVKLGIALMVPALPDNEELIHAFFDLAASKGPGVMIPKDELLEQFERYATSSRQRA